MPPSTATRQHPGTSFAVDHHAAFLTQFAAQEADARASKRPAPLSAEQHAAHRKQLDKVEFIKPKLARESQFNVTVIFKKWKRYCRKMKVGPWKATMQSITRGIMQDFFLWVCLNHKNIKSWGTTQVYIRQFQELHTNITGRYPDRNDMKELYKYHDVYLKPRLRAPNVDGKPVLNVDALRVILVYNIAYDDGVQPLERQRINLSGCYMIICYTGARPAELVNNERKPPKDGSFEELFNTKAVVADVDVESDDGDGDDAEASDPDSMAVSALLLQETIGRNRPKALCYEDILMMLVRHPVTGRSIVAMSIKFIHHKGCDKKPKPTIFFFTPAKKLIFCPILLFLGLALSDHAFDAQCLRDANSVLTAEVPAGRPCVPLRWKESLLKTPFFRRVARDGTVSQDEAMLYSTLREQMGAQSEGAGFEERWTPRFGRRGAANAANGDAPDSVRDQMMRQDPRFFTFWSAYLNEIANFDLQNAFLEEEKEDQLFRLFAHVSLTRDPRATRDMVPQEVWDNMPPDPEITELEEERARLKQGRYRFDGLENEDKIREISETIRSKRSQLEKRAVKRYRTFYFRNRPTWDLERQARGDDVEQYEVPAIDLAIPERARLAKLLCHQPENLTDEERCRLSIKVVDCYDALCDKRETVKRKRLRSPTDAAPPTASKRIKHESAPAPAPSPFPLLMGATQCPDCLGDERLTEQERAFCYCRPTKRNDHFDDHHLEERERAERSREPVVCKHPACKAADVKLKTVDHFRNHVERVHGVKLRSSGQAEDRRERKRKLRRSRQPG